MPADLAIDPRASALADRVAAVVLQLHRDAIIAGVRADDGESQPALNPRAQDGWNASRGRRPAARGNTGKGGGFPDTLRRAKTKKAAGDTNAEVRIIAPRGPAPWLRAEQERGVTYFFTTGLVADEIERVTFQWLDEITRPGPKKRR